MSSKMDLMALMPGVLMPGAPFAQAYVGPPRAPEWVELC
jgi:hypothetical protein